MRLLTDEQLKRVDEIITDEINLEIDYVFNGEDSLPEIDGYETLRNAARAGDKCGLSIEPLDPAFNGRQVAGGGSLVVLARTNGGMGHNQVPLDGWHFHYLCFCGVVDAILEAFQPSTTKYSVPDRPRDTLRRDPGRATD